MRMMKVTKFYVIKADLDNHPNCINDEEGVYVNKRMNNYSSLKNAMRFYSYEEASRHATESWEIVEAIR